MANPPANSIETLNAARAAKRRLRAQTLVALENEMIDMWDVVLLAATPEGSALKSIPISTLLLTLPHWTRRMATDTLTTFKASLSLPRDTPDRKTMISLLIDRRRYSSGVLALVDAMSIHERPCPALRFPFAEIGDQRTC
ncbi:MAG: hypothetical protein ACYDEP_02530 [Acidimicrobiales bacterium]